MMDGFENRDGAAHAAVQLLGSICERDDLVREMPPLPCVPQPAETGEPGAIRVLCAGANMLLYGIVGVLNDLARSEVIWTRSLHEVLQRAAAGERFDIVLLDTALPDLDGFEGMKRA